LNCSSYRSNSFKSRSTGFKRLNEQVKVISRKLEAQGQTQEVQTDLDRTKSLETPIVRASDEGFRFSSPNDDYRIRFAG
jgi:hypothetical protein